MSTPNDTLHALWIRKATAEAELAELQLRHLVRGADVQRDQIVITGFVTTAEMRDIALRVNDGRLNRDAVSVNQVREILRAVGHDVEEAE
jgi:hypothetical protein